MAAQPDATLAAPTSQLAVTLAERVSLLDAVDHLLNRGVVLVGHTTLSLAGVDLIYLGLNLLVSSVETLQAGRPSPPSPSRLDGELVPSALPPGGGGAGGEGELAGEGAGRETADAPLRASRAVEYARSSTPPAPPAPAPAIRHLAGLPEQLAADDAESPAQGLARLVLALVELLRQLLERQAVRRMEGGSVADDQVERMGMALMELEAKMAELRAIFGLKEDDLNLDLGPLGQLL